MRRSTDEEAVINAQGEKRRLRSHATNDDDGGGRAENERPNRSEEQIILLRMTNSLWHQSQWNCSEMWQHLAAICSHVLYEDEHYIPLLPPSPEEENIRIPPL